MKTYQIHKSYRGMRSGTILPDRQVSLESAIRSAKMAQKRAIARGDLEAYFVVVETIWENGAQERVFSTES